MFIVSAALSAFRKSRLITVFLAVAAFATISLDSARAEYPDHQVTIIACFPAGGGTDLAARMIHVELGKALGQPVIIENRGGAGGSIGTGVVARASNDGYTLLACSSAFVVNPSLYEKVPYDPFKDFTPIMVFGASPNVFVVPAQSKIQTMVELIAEAKANPGKMNWTSPGVGTTPQLAGELLKIKAGLDMQHIPYAGAGPANTAVLGGLVDFYVANYGSLTGLLSGGKVRPIAVTSKKRWPDLPNVPTLDEIGIKDAESDTFQGLFAPMGTPKPIVDRLAKEISKILAEPEMKAKYAKLGLPVLAEGPEVFAARIKREVPMYKEVVEKAGLKIKNN
jgi:tripartite-type tricarboxylate transporter receptor subunit TctC